MGIRFVSAPPAGAEVCGGTAVHYTPQGALFHPTGQDLPVGTVLTASEIHTMGGDTPTLDEEADAGIAVPPVGSSHPGTFVVGPGVADDDAAGD